MIGEEDGMDDPFNVYFGRALCFFLTLQEGFKDFDTINLF
jgi:hypothetical protein